MRIAYLWCELGNGVLGGGDVLVDPSHVPGELLDLGVHVGHGLDLTLHAQDGVGEAGHAGPQGGQVSLDPGVLLLVVGQLVLQGLHGDIHRGDHIVQRLQAVLDACQLPVNLKHICLESVEFS